MKVTVMKLKRKPVLIGCMLLILLPALVLVGVVGYFVLPSWLEDPTEPPALLTSAELGDSELLFDGETTAGWKIDGPARVRDGILELGGDQPATAMSSDDVVSARAARLRG